MSGNEEKFDISASMREPQFLTRSEPSSLEPSFEEGKRNFPFPFFFFLTRHSDVCACILPVKIFEDRANLNLIHAGILREIIVSRKENRKTRFSKLFSIFPVNENHLLSLHLSLHLYTWIFQRTYPIFFSFFIHECIAYVSHEGYIKIRI